MTSPTSPPLPHHDIAILGGGLGGLLAANLILEDLSPAQRRTTTLTLFEANTRFGGRARSPSLGEPWSATVNLGPHALYKNGPLHHALDRLGIMPPGASPAAHPMWLDASSATGQADLISLPASLGQILGHDRMTFRQKTRLMLAMRAILAADTRSTHGMASQWIASLSSGDPFLSALLGALIRLSTYCADLEHLPAVTAVTQLQRSLTDGVLYIDGGWQTIIDALLERLHAFPNVRVEAGCKVTHLDRAERDGAMRLVFADRERPAYTASHVVAALPPRTVPKITDQKVLQNHHIEPVHAACIDLLLRKNPARRRVAIYGMYEPYYYANHSATARFMDGDEVEVVHAAKYLRRGEEAGGIAQLERWLDAVDPCWRADTVASRRLPKIPVIQHLPSSKSSSSLVHDLDNLYVVGDWCEPPPHHLADAVARSAARASEHICARVRP